MILEQKGAYNLRYNGVSLCHGDSEYVKIRRKEDKEGVNVYISGRAQGETIHIPVVVAQSGVVDVVYMISISKTAQMLRL